MSSCWVSTGSSIIWVAKCFGENLLEVDDSDGKESACNAGDSDLIPGLGTAPGEGNEYPLQNSCLENSMDRGRHSTFSDFSMNSCFGVVTHVAAFLLTLASLCILVSRLEPLVTIRGSETYSFSSSILE